MQYECNYNHNLCILVQFPVPRLFVQVTCVRHLRCRLQARLAIADTDLLFFFLRALLLTHFRETDFFMGPHILTELEGIICKKKSIFFLFEFLLQPAFGRSRLYQPYSLEYSYTYSTMYIYTDLRVTLVLEMWWPTLILRRGIVLYVLQISMVRRYILYIFIIYS